MELTFYVVGCAITVY